jgi:hypothetical protein
MPRILFVGDDFYGSNATSLRNSFFRMGCEVLTVNTHFLGTSTVPRRLAARYGRDDARYPEPRTEQFNGHLQRLIESWLPDILFVVKGLFVDPQTLTAAANCMRVHYHPDDSRNPVNTSRRLRLSEPLYDLHVTTKTFNVDELRGRKARAVLYIPCAYDRDWHRPARSPQGRTYLLGFIGTRRPDRVALIRSLGFRLRDRLLVAGSRWRGDIRLRRTSIVLGPQYGHDFSLAVALTRCQLGLLNSDNRDLHTCRTFEVPASGGLLLAERTTEHQELLAEGHEALFFDDEDELLDALNRVASSPSIASRIAQAGYRRITEGRHTYDDRVVTILDSLG